MKNILSRAHSSLMMLARIWRCLLPIALLPISHMHAQVQLVKDIEPGSAVEIFSRLIGYKEKAYFVFTHDDNTYPPNSQLWVSDGTYEGTGLLIELNNIGNLIVSGSHLYFTASEYVPECSQDQDPPEPCPYTPHGQELWKTDGTVAGTALVKDIFPGVSGSNPQNLVNVNGVLFFSANDGKTGRELWRTDGTVGGTALVKDIMRVTGSSNPLSFTLFNGQLYFTASDGQHGRELWKTDGTDPGTVLVVDIMPELKNSSNPHQIQVANGNLYFFASDPVNKKQLWRSNGKANNASIVKVIRPGGANNLDHLTSVNGLLYFQANDGIHGIELWKSDGTSGGTSLLKDITPGPASASGYVAPHLSGFQSANGKLYFTAFTNGPYYSSHDIWTSDGTTAGTVQLTYPEHITFGFNIPHVTAFRGEAYFRGNVEKDMGNLYSFTSELWKTNGTPQGTVKVQTEVDDPNGYHWFVDAVVGDYLFFIGFDAIWKTDGTADGTEKIREVRPARGSTPAHLTDLNGALMFSALGGQLWKSTGTAETTQKLHRDIENARALTSANGLLYLAASDYRQLEPWKSDGSTDGTTIIKDISPWPAGSDPSEFTRLNSVIVFRAAALGQPYDLWKTDGTEAGTTTIKDVTRENFINPRSLMAVGSKLFFLGENTRTGEELWVTDGTKSGTNLVKDIKYAERSSGAIRFTGFRNILYFQADDGAHGYELWRSDGTRTGTFMLKNIRPGDRGTPPELSAVDMGNMMATSDNLFLTAITPSGKNGLWKSDGTSSGTTLVAEFDGKPGADILAAIGNKIIFCLSYGSYGELWISDGTPARTLKIKTIPAFHSVVFPYEVATLNNVIYFLGNDEQQSRIWRTDGTNSGTYDIVFNGKPTELETSGGIVYVSATTERWGWELFRIVDQASTANSVTEKMTLSQDNNPANLTGENNTSHYPNPFSSGFVLRVNGDEEDHFEINILSMDGRKEHHSMKYNKDYTLGESWKPGVYILQVFSNQEYSTFKLLKK